MFDFIFAEKVSDPICHLFDDIVFEGHDCWEVDCGVGGFDAAMGEVMGEVVEAVGGIEEGFGGDAADVETGSAEEFSFDAGDFQAELRGADGGGVSAGSGSDDDEVEIALGHSHWHLMTVRCSVPLCPIFDN